jgi:hypothetical protein
MCPAGSLAFVLALTVGALACVADPYGDLPPSPAPTEGSATTTSCSPTPPVQSADASTLPVCTGTKGTKGRCLEASALGATSERFEQASCSAGQACIPDDVIKAGAKLELKKCTGVLDTEGRCFWPLAKEIVANYDTLKAASHDCAEEMICAPCVNPLTKKETGLCKLGGSGGGGASCSEATQTSAAAPGGNAGTAATQGTCPQVDPTVDVSSFSAEDCGSNMLCVDTSLVPPAQQEKLTNCSKGKCVPKKSVERGGKYVSKTCRSTGDTEGRCLNVGIPSIGQQATKLPAGDGCDADERCAPCFDPRTGNDTGACTASCDSPKEPKKVFPGCCADRGRCVPPTALSGSAASILSQESCTGEAVCAPNELVGVTPPKRCKATFGLVSGVCIPGCTLVIGSVIQGDCADGEMCAPCQLLPDGTCR